MYDPSSVNPALSLILRQCRTQSYQNEEKEQSIIQTPNFNRFLKQQFYEKPKLNLNFDIDDMDCLRGVEWVNDAVLNSYLALCFNNIPDDITYKIGLTNSFFMKKLDQDGCKAAECWQGIKGQPLNQYDLFIIPVCCGSHWIMATVNFMEQEIQILDSLHGNYRNVGRKINEFLNFQGIDSLKITHPSVPSQMNGYDCGVFVMEFGRCLMHGINLNSFGQRDMPQARRRIFSELQPFAKR
ncbi:Clan CE, family C48, Ulp1-like cysteine peptidase [Tritrichomonas foetus]|uniref:Clan CE, family C48, Ulp1-like cysteine peptidase n=1 Tax=Tritrichomonas foetus TaxID=1144522 RepID=A0A1J4KHE7_9EUKA|nr:Clan CE, family C48, Ulp1-like cysteine peptidase [Tritrichomonas foetus]|eukprot:OHT10368.1 Clan CE, family C48, Ulp1-like cysteine peptidase [Tritrichomonas foetus]